MLKSLFSWFVLAAIRLMAVLFVGWLFLDDLLWKLKTVVYRLQIAMR